MLLRLYVVVFAAASYGSYPASGLADDSTRANVTN